MFSVTVQKQLKLLETDTSLKFKILKDLKA